MLMRKNIAIALLALALLVAVSVSGCTSGAAGTAEPSATPAPTATPEPSCCSDPKESLGDIPGYNIVITGGNVSPVTLSYADLKAMDFVETGNVSKMNMHGDGVEMMANYAGVPVTAILARAGVPDDSVTFRISAPDGYSMDYSRTILDHAIIALVQNGSPAVADIDNRSAIVLVMPDQRGPLWVKVPTQIEIVKG